MYQNFNKNRVIYDLILPSLLLVAFLSFSKSSISQNSSQLKKSITVSDFEDATKGNVQTTDSSSQSGWQTNQINDPNSQTTSNNLVKRLTDELYKTGLFIVPPPEEAVQMIVTGDILKWENKIKTRVDLKNNTHNQYMSTVSIVLRVVDGSTGQIITAQTASKTAKQNNLFVENPDNTLDDAIRDVVTQCISYIKRAAIKVEWQGSIVKAEQGGIIFIKPGSSGGVATGMLFDVFEKGEELKDNNGQSLGFDLKKVGSIKVTSDIGNGKAAKAIAVSDNGIKSGDIVRSRKK
jgi:hypothetical protein